MDVSLQETELKKLETHMLTLFSWPWFPAVPTAKFPVAMWVSENIHKKTSVVIKIRLSPLGEFFSLVNHSNSDYYSSWERSTC